MSDVRIKIGGEFFREIRQNSCYYADKTALIEELLCKEAPKVSLITRPRRFGKTLMMTMLRDFFDITQDSKTIFDGLAISKNQALCDKWMNQYPVIFITLKEIESQNFSQAVEQIRTLVREVSVLYSYLLKSDKVNDSDKRILQDFLDSKSAISELKAFLRTLCRALHAHWGKPVILLIDEYDVPLAKAQEKGYYLDMVDFIRNMLGAVLKTNDFLQFSILTGCLRISKESIFTGLNNFACYDISEFNFDDKFGFTSQEVDDLLAVAGCSEKKDVIKEWYDGYRFGNNKEMYCPWDILQYLCTLKTNPNAKPESYWENTSGNNIIRSFIERTDFNADDEIENLLAGRYVTCTINKTITYDKLYESEDNFWTLLYLSGYLTKADPDKVNSEEGSPDSGETPLIIPNREIWTLFVKNIKSWFNDSMKAMDRKPLFDAFWNGDSKGFQEMFSEILLRTISYHDYHENYYHAVLTGLFIGSGYKARSNPESGLGRPDITVKGKRYTQAAIIEVKHAKSREDMPKAADDALRQIKGKLYTAEVSDYRKVMLWGISFYEKFCACRAEELLQPQPANY